MSSAARETDVCVNGSEPGLTREERAEDIPVHRILGNNPGGEILIREFSVLGVFLPDIPKRGDGASDLLLLRSPRERHCPPVRHLNWDGRSEFADEVEGRSLPISKCLFSDPLILNIVEEQSHGLIKRLGESRRVLYLGRPQGDVQCDPEAQHRDRDCDRQPSESALKSHAPALPVGQGSRHFPFGPRGSTVSGQH